MVRKKAENLRRAKVAEPSARSKEPGSRTGAPSFQETAQVAVDVWMTRIPIVLEDRQKAIRSQDWR